MNRAVVIAAALLVACLPALAAEPIEPDVEEDEFVDEFVEEEDWPEEPREVEPLWGHVTVGLGVRQIGEDPAGFAVSVETDLQRTSWPVGLVFNMNLAVADGPVMEDEWFGPTGTTIELVDFGIGARKVFNRGKAVQPFVSIGGSVYFAGVQSCEYYGWCGGSVDNDVTFGPFADAGMFFRTSGKSLFGLRVRYSVGDVELVGQQVALDGVDLQMSWGMGF